MVIVATHYDITLYIIILLALVTSYKLNYVVLIYYVIWCNMLCNCGIIDLARKYDESGLVM